MPVKQYAPRIRLSQAEYNMIIKQRKSGVQPTDEPQELQTRILLFDIETAPATGYYWRRYDENITQPQVIHEGYMLCYSAKWLGDPVTMIDSLPYYEQEYGADPKDDSTIIRSLWKLLDQADIVIAHNGKKFDLRYFNARCAYHKITPPSPYKIVDTLKLARSLFNFPSNKLNDLAEYLGIGQKEETGGFKLWRDVVSGDAESWETMCTYCIHDTDLLEEVYLRLRGWDKMAPSVAVFFPDSELHCLVCGSTDLQQGHPVYTSKSSFDSYQCNCCGHWNRMSINNFNRKKRESLMMNVL